MPEVRDPKEARAGAIEERYDEYTTHELPVPEHLQSLYDTLDAAPGGSTETEPPQVWPTPMPTVPTEPPTEEAVTAEATEEPVDRVADEGKPDETWTNAEIVAYAEANNIDLDGATKKADMLAAIEAAA